MARVSRCGDIVFTINTSVLDGVRGRRAPMIDEHDRLIGLIYDGIADDAQWDLTLAKIASLANAAGVGLGL